MRTAVSPIARAVNRLGASGTWPIYALLLIVFLAIITINPGFGQPGPLLNFAKQAAPLAVLAVGQYFVIVSGEIDLSVGSLVGAQVVIAAKLIDGDEAATWPVLGVMLLFGLAVGLVNGLVTTLLRVPSFITTLGMMLVLYGAIRLWTGGSPTGSLSESFRALGRGGIAAGPGSPQISWSLVTLLVVGVLAVLLMRRPFGRVLTSVGDNDRAALFSGVPVWWVRTRAFLLSGLAATVAAVLLAGYAGVTAQVGQGLEFMAITAVVLGGVVLTGGRGTVVAAIGGALVLEALFVLFNQLYVPSTIRPAIQGLIIIAAVAYASMPRRRRRRRPDPATTERQPVPVAS